MAGAILSLGGLRRSSANLYVYLQALAVAPLIVLTLRRAAIGAVVSWARRPPCGLWSHDPGRRVRGPGRAPGGPRAPGHTPATAWPRLGLARLLGAGLAASRFFPSWACCRKPCGAPVSAREVALGHATPPLALLQVLVPNLFGPLSDPVQSFWGGLLSRLPYFLSLYLGPLALALAWAGLPELPRRARIAVAVLGLLGVWFALGKAGGLAPLLMPLLRAVRYPSKAWLPPYLAVTVCAGLGAGALFAGRRWRRFSLGCLGLAAFSSLLLAVLAFLPERVRLLADLPAGFFPAIRGSLLLGTATATVLALVGAGLGALAEARLVQPALGAAFSPGPSCSTWCAPMPASTPRRILVLSPRA